jgi:hypothetical protein
MNKTVTIVVVGGIALAILYFVLKSKSSPLINQQSPFGDTVGGAAGGIGWGVGEVLKGVADVMKADDHVTDNEG